MKITIKNDQITIFLLSFLLTVINSLTFTNNVISLGLALCETLTILFFVMRVDYKNFIIYYLLFSSTTIESSLFTLRSHSYERYSFFRLPIIAYYHLFFFMVILYFLIRITRRKSAFNNKRDAKWISILVLGFIMTFVSYLSNDNGVYEIQGMFRFSIIDAYETVWLIFYALLIFYAFDNEKSFVYTFKDLSVSMMIGISLGGIVLYLLGNFSQWTSTTMYLVCPIAFFYTPALMLLCFEKKQGLFYLCIGIICAIIQTKYSVGIPGAFWLFLLTVLILFYAKLFRNIRLSSKRPLFTFLAILSIIAIPIAYSFISDTLNPNSSYSSFKLSTLVSLFTFNSGFNSWYIALGSSVGIRVEQIINVFIEVFKKPLALLFGKGFGGTSLKYWGIYNWNDYGSVFPDLQINARVYSSFLTGIVEIIINYGMIGIIFLYRYIKDGIIELFRKNGSWMFVVGVYWLLVFLYFYNSMMIGLVWLCVGAYEMKKIDSFQNGS